MKFFSYMWFNILAMIIVIANVIFNIFSTAENILLLMIILLNSRIESHFRKHRKSETSGKQMYKLKK